MVPVIFSDASKYILDRPKQKRYARRRKKIKLVQKDVISKHKFDRGKIEVWEYATSYGPRSIVRKESRMDPEVYLNILKEHLKLKRHTYIFQSDNDPTLNTAIVVNWRLNKGIDKLSRPSNSTNLIIMKNICD